MRASDYCMVIIAQCSYILPSGPCHVRFMMVVYLRVRSSAERQATDGWSRASVRGEGSRFVSAYECWIDRSRTTIDTWMEYGPDMQMHARSLHLPVALR